MGELMGMRIVIGIGCLRQRQLMISIGISIASTALTRNKSVNKRQEKKEGRTEPFNPDLPLSLHCSTAIAISSSEA